MDDGNLIYKTLDGRNGLAEHAPYDCIHIGAAVKEIPRNILQQLSSGGRLVSFIFPPKSLISPVALSVEGVT